MIASGGAAGAAAYVIYPSGATGGRWGRLSCWLGAGSLAWFSPLIVALIMAPRTGTPWFRAIPLGLIERGLVITEVAAIAALALWALAATRPAVPVVGRDQVMS